MSVRTSKSRRRPLPGPEFSAAVRDLRNDRAQPVLRIGSPEWREQQVKDAMAAADKRRMSLARSAKIGE